MSYAMRANLEALQQRTYGMHFQQLAGAYYTQQSQQQMAHLWQTQPALAEAVARQGWNMPVRAESVQPQIGQMVWNQLEATRLRRFASAPNARQSKAPSGFAFGHPTPQSTRPQFAGPAVVAESVDRDAKRPCTERTIAHVASVPRASAVATHTVAAPASGATQAFAFSSQRPASQPPQVARMVRPEGQQTLTFGQRQSASAQAPTPLQTKAGVAFRFPTVERASVVAAVAEATSQAAQAELATPVRANAVRSAESMGGVVKASVVQPSPVPANEEQRKSPDVEEALTLLMLQAGGSDTVERPRTPSAFCQAAAHRPVPLRALTVAKPAVAVSA